ncbi:MAG TPA: hypothetical protein VEY95_00650 [Azospirillaceae bacterium]|nr:hypothetical protein [Azospirillaceae bacterium]
MKGELQKPLRRGGPYRAGSGARMDEAALEQWIHEAVARSRGTMPLTLVAADEPTATRIRSGLKALTGEMRKQARVLDVVVDTRYCSG